MNVRRAVLGGSIAVAALLAAAPPALGFGLTPSVQPQTAPAGSNSDLQINIQIQQPAQDLKDLTVHLPPGLVGNPQVAAKCTVEQLNAAACPTVSDVGDVVNDIQITDLNGLPIPPIPQSVSGDVFNMVPQPGEPARFGIVLSATPVPLPGGLLPPIILQSPASLRQSDFGLDTVLTDLPRRAQLSGGLSAGIDITSVGLTLKGLVNTLGFIRLPTSCKEHTVGFDANSYDGGPASAQTTFATTDCGALPFGPGFEATVRPQGTNGLKPELTTVISQTLAEAGLLRAQVILPSDLGADNAVLNNQCEPAQFEAGACPENTIIGSAVAASPLQTESLNGPVALVRPPTPGLPQVGLDLRGPLALKLLGSFVFTSQGTGVEFNGLPDIPIARFQLTFFGGDAGLVLAARSVCDPPPLEFKTDFLAHSGAAVAGTTAAKVAGSCAGADGKRKPKAKVKLGKLGSDEPKLKLTVKAGAERMRTARLKLPKKLGFASGKAFKRGAKAKANGKKLKGKKVKHTKRALRLKGKRAKRFVAKVGGGALEAAADVRRRMRFKVKVVDVRGARTTLAVKSK
ncbi:MAG: hypothetical protein ACRDLO_07730 [Solirubrobacterales bacterium]